MPGPAFRRSRLMFSQLPLGERECVLPLRPGLEHGVATMATASGGAVKASRVKKGVERRLRQVQRAAILLKQVSDPTRLQVILMLSEGEKHVGALCEELNQSQPAVSHHLALLRHGGIITPRRQGKNNFYALTETGEELAQVVKTVIE